MNINESINKTTKIFLTIISKFINKKELWRKLSWWSLILSVDQHWNVALTGPLRLVKNLQHCLLLPEMVIERLRDVRAGVSASCILCAPRYHLPCEGPIHSIMPADHLLLLHGWVDLWMYTVEIHQETSKFLFSIAPNHESVVPIAKPALQLEWHRYNLQLLELPHVKVHDQRDKWTPPCQHHQSARRSHCPTGKKWLWAHVEIKIKYMLGTSQDLLYWDIMKSETMLKLTITSPGSNIRPSSFWIKCAESGTKGSVSLMYRWRSPVRCFAKM